MGFDSKTLNYKKWNQLVVYFWLQHFSGLTKLSHEVQSEPKEKAVVLQKCHVFWIFSPINKNKTGNITRFKTLCVFISFSNIFFTTASKFVYFLSGPESLATATSFTNKSSVFHVPFLNLK